MQTEGAAASSPEATAGAGPFSRQEAGRACWCLVLGSYLTATLAAGAHRRWLLALVSGRMHSGCERAFLTLKDPSSFRTWTEQRRAGQRGAGGVRRRQVTHAGAAGGAGAALEARVVPVPHVDSFVVVAARVAPS